MTTVAQPSGVDQYFDEAQRFVRDLVTRLPLNTVFLDDWHADDNKTGGRLIYGAPCVGECKSECLQCHVYREVGQEVAGLRTGLHTKLCPANDNHHELFALAQDEVELHQRMLNCKSFVQFMEAFVLYTVERCLTFEELDAELRWVLGVRLVYWFGQFDPTVLKVTEYEFKRRLILEIYLRLKADDIDRKTQVAEFAIMHNLQLST